MTNARYIILFLIPIAMIAAGCKKTDLLGPQKIPPVKIETQREGTLPILTLTPEAEKRLALEVVALKNSGSLQMFIVPVSAVLYTSEGFNWVYFQKAPNTYQRIRVQLHAIKAAFATVTTELKENTPIVFEGASELFGSEAGVGK